MAGDSLLWLSLHPASVYDQTQALAAPPVDNNTIKSTRMRRGDVIIGMQSEMQCCNILHLQESRANTTMYTCERATTRVCTYKSVHLQWRALTRAFASLSCVMLRLIIRLMRSYLKVNVNISLMRSYLKFNVDIKIDEVKSKIQREHQMLQNEASYTYTR